MWWGWRRAGQLVWEHFGWPKGCPLLPSGAMLVLRKLLAVSLEAATEPRAEHHCSPRAPSLQLPGAGEAVLRLCGSTFGKRCSTLTTSLGCLAQTSMGKMALQDVCCAPSPGFTQLCPGG